MFHYYKNNVFVRVSHVPHSRKTAIVDSGQLISLSSNVLEACINSVVQCTILPSLPLY